MLYESDNLRIGRMYDGYSISRRDTWLNTWYFVGYFATLEEFYDRGDCPDSEAIDLLNQVA